MKKSLKAVLLKIMLAVSCVTFVPLSPAATLDPESAANPQLDKFYQLFRNPVFDLARNLNLRSIARNQPARPVLGALADIPPGFIPSSEELLNWEVAFHQNETALLALVLPTDGETLPAAENALWQSWVHAAPEARVIIDYANTDQAVIDSLQAQLKVAGVTFQVLTDNAVQAGHYYSSAHHRWIIDSEAARAEGIETLAFSLLGRSVDPDINLVRARPDRAARRLASSEPEVFRKAGLGNEFEASSIPEIIVPGGIALGEKAVIDTEDRVLIFRNGSLLFRLLTGEEYSLPEESLPELKAAFDFAQRAQRIKTVAVVDIDARGRVKISAALRDTDAGYEMVQADIAPFEIVKGLPAEKSIILDSQVIFSEKDDESVTFSTDYEVRFLRADRMRIAQTRVALEYRYRDHDRQVSYLDNWGTDVSRLRDSTDYQLLGEKTVEVARYAAWVALFRLVLEQELQFVDGFYQFLKINASGRETPSRL